MKLIKTIELTGDFTWLYDIDWSPNGDKILFLTWDNNTAIICNMDY